jgi:hypothetical protein
MALFTYETKKDTRSGFGAGMEYLSQNNPKVVALCADLIGSLKLEAFIKNSPERFFQTETLTGAVSQRPFISTVIIYPLCRAKPIRLPC